MSNFVDNFLGKDDDKNSKNEPEHHLIIFVLE